MRYKITTPNINLQAKDPRLAYAARATTLIGSVVILLLELFNLLSGDVNIIPILLGVIPLIVEFDVFTLMLKSPLFRGIAYLILGIVLMGFTQTFTAVIIVFAGSLFIIYNFQ